MKKLLTAVALGASLTGAASAQVISLLDGTRDYFSGNFNPAGANVTDVDWDGNAAPDYARVVPYGAYDNTALPGAAGAFSFRGGAVGIDVANNTVPGTAPQPGILFRFAEVIQYNGVNQTDVARIGFSQNVQDRFAGVFLFGSPEPIAVGGVQNFNMVIRSIANTVGLFDGTGASFQARWVVESGGQTYLSELNYTATQMLGTQGVYQLLTLEAPTTINWAAHTFDSTAASLVANPVSFSAQTFDQGITAVGLYLNLVEEELAGNGNTAYDIAQVFVAIPEPSAFAALAGLGALGFAASRRRRRA